VVNGGLHVEGVVRGTLVLGRLGVLAYEANCHRVRLTIWGGIKPVGQTQSLGIGTRKWVASEGHDLQGPMWVCVSNEDRRRI
jgi:hypothetical protein